MIDECLIVPSPCIFRLRGKDVIRYLNARLTCDVKRLNDRECAVGAALSPQGKTEAFFSIVRLSSDEVLLSTSGVPSSELIEPLLRYRVADRLTLEDHSTDYVLLHVVGACNLGGKSLTVKDPSEVVVMNEQVVLWSALRSNVWGWDIIIPKLLAESLLESFSPSDKNHGDYLRQLRFKAGIPAFPDEIRPGRLFQETSIDIAITPNKGCYVGQEVVEKIVSRGRAPKLLVHLVGSNPCIVGDVVILNGQEVGEIVSFASDLGSGSPFRGFALVRSQCLPVDGGELSFTVGDSAYLGVTVSSLLSGLYNSLGKEELICSAC